MKLIKRTAIIIALIALFTPFANAQFRYGPIMGGTLTNLHFKQDLATVKKTPAFQAGIQGELMFPGIGFGIDLGLLYNLGGAKVNLGEKEIWSSQGYGNERLMLHQLTLPVHLRFKYTRLNGLEEYLAPFVYGGPDFNINVMHSNCKAMDFSGGDVSLVAGLGVELYKKWQVSGSYTWGMTYAMKTKLLTDYSARTRQWTIRLAYLF